MRNSDKRATPPTEPTAEQFDTVRRSLEELLVASQHLVSWLVRRNYAPDVARRVAMDPEDYVQEVMLCALKRFRQFDPAQCAFGTWLSGIAQDISREVFCRVKYDQRNALQIGSTARDPDGTDVDRFAKLADKNASDPGHGAALVRVLVPVEEMTLGAVSFAWVLDVRTNQRVQVPVADVIKYHDRLFAVAVSFDEDDDGLHRVRFGSGAVAWVRAAVTEGT